jgi:DNA-binding XRE family transcriptional regulator
MNPTNIFEFQPRGKPPKPVPEPPSDTDSSKCMYGCEEYAEVASRLLPAWFIPRMMTDTWSFGLTLVTGLTLAISSILDVQQAADGSIWLDVRMLNCEGSRPSPGRWNALETISFANQRSHDCERRCRLRRVRCRACIHLKQRAHPRRKQECARQKGDTRTMLTLQPEQPPDKPSVEDDSTLAFRRHITELVKRSRTQSEFARALGVSQASVNRWISGKRTPRLKYILQIATRTNVTADWLLLGLN